MRNRPFCVICAVDFAESSISVIDHALEEGQRHSKAAIHFITVLESGKGGILHTEPSLLELEDADSKMRALVAEELPAFADRDAGASRTLRFHTRVGKAGDEILELSLEARADRIFVGRHGACRRRRAMGSIAVQVVYGAVCTVQVVQLTDYEGAQRDYEQCAKCIQLREDTGGSEWFCDEHHTGRRPRLMRNIGVTTPTPGWGIF